ncbi:hypothetical protein FA15DRAFT_660593 [Coprinopsis marcescibilis]|uniref:Uncharacterized protein n=1 Tax=Coprinopsis marcescibilis TaxID=230819 RepID=A0A5C3KFW3_COPMA|nr:hypothetical protein FA15DRAFT_660593 [Coprinopsis marcescibilis]
MPFKDRLRRCSPTTAGEQLGGPCTTANFLNYFRKFLLHQLQERADVGDRTGQMRLLLTWVPIVPLITGWGWAGLGARMARLTLENTHKQRKAISRRQTPRSGSSKRKLSKTNILCRSVVMAYIKRAWDVESFLQRYVSNPMMLINLLDGIHAAAFGEAVLSFFLRRTDSPQELDVVVDLHAFSSVTLCLEHLGYAPVSSSSKGTYEDQLRDIIERYTSNGDLWSNAGEMGSMAEDHLGLKFRYKKLARRPAAGRLYISVHLVRAALACYMTRNYSVCTFPHAVFKRFKSYPFIGDGSTDSKKIQQSSQCLKIGTTKPFDVFDVVTAWASENDQDAGDILARRRHFGDNHCWTIHRSQGPFDAPPSFKGPSFEVSDFFANWPDHTQPRRRTQPMEPLLREHLLREAKLLMHHVQSVGVHRHDAPGSIPVFVVKDGNDDTGATRPTGTKTKETAPSHILVLALPVDGKPFEYGAEVLYLPSEMKEKKYNKVIDLSLWFPNGAYGAQLSSIPGSSIPLGRAYRVFVDALIKPAPLNTSIRDVFSVPWMGNVVVVRFSKTIPTNPVQLGRHEALYILLSVGV